jgi:hypothetical protein
VQSLCKDGEARATSATRTTRARADFLQNKHPE